MSSYKERFQRNLREVMGTEAGRNLVSEFLRHCGFDNDPFDRDPLVMARNAGMLASARWWIGYIRELCPEREPQMRKEAKRNAKTDAEPKAEYDPFPTEHDHD